MAYEARFRVQCEHDDCRATIIFGHYLISPKTLGDLATLPSIEPGKLRCPLCGRHTNYSHEDVTVLPLQTVSV